MKILSGGGIDDEANKSPLLKFPYSGYGCAVEA